MQAGWEERNQTDEEEKCVGSLRIEWMESDGANRKEGKGKERYTKKTGKGGMV